MDKNNGLSLVERAAARLALQPDRVADFAGPVQQARVTDFAGPVQQARVTDFAGPVQQARVKRQQAKQASVLPRDKKIATLPETVSPPAREKNSDGPEAAIISWRPSRSSPQIRFDPSRLRAAGLVDWNTGRTQIVEEFRILKRHILQNALSSPNDSCERPRNLIMVTSSQPGEGKTFTALNLAISIAMEPDRQVLLVDACENENSVRSLTRPAQVCGWLDLMNNPATNVGDALLTTEIPRLNLMLPGARQKHDAELLASGRMKALLRELADRYSDRIVLIDAPACLVTSDPAALARVVGQTLLVVEADVTTQQRVEAALELLRPGANTYLVLNKTRFR